MATQLQTQPFAVPMANMNLPPSEALNQIMDNLNHLNAIVNQAVTTIHSRIKQESQLLSSISKRIDNAYKKTALIASNPNKSTTIFSSPHYPTTTSNSQPITNGTNIPLINKATHTKDPILPKRSKYNLSLKQRNQKPQNTETVSLLQSINEKTTKKKSKKTILQNTEIPEWVTSVTDCMVFDTNCNAYKPSKSPEMQRRRHKKRKSRSINTDNEAKMAEAPPSIGNPHYNSKTERNAYGERIKYRCVLDRPNMPKCQFNSNLFDVQNKTGNGNGNIAVANDVKWVDNSDKKEKLFIIPSDVLNERYMNMQFEFGDDIKPPTPKQILVENEIELDEKEDEKAEVMPVHNYPTPKEIIVDEQKQKQNKEKENDTSQMKQPVVTEVKAQNEPLQRVEDVSIEEKKEIVVRKEDKMEDKKDKGIDKGVKRFVFDANVLKNAKAKLNKKKDKSESERKKDVAKEENMQGNIFMAIKNLRKFHADSDDEEDDNGSFDDSD